MVRTRLVLRVWGSGLVVYRSRLVLTAVPTLKATRTASAAALSAKQIRDDSGTSWIFFESVGGGAIKQY